MHISWPCSHALSTATVVGLLAQSVVGWGESGAPHSTTTNAAGPWPDPMRVGWQVIEWHENPRDHSYSTDADDDICFPFSYSSSSSFPFSFSSSSCLMVGLFCLHMNVNRASRRQESLQSCTFSLTNGYRYSTQSPAQEHSPFLIL